MDSNSQPEARIESSCRVRLEVKGMNWATKASNVGSPTVPSTHCQYPSNSCVS